MRRLELTEYSVLAQRYLLARNSITRYATMRLGLLSHISWRYDTSVLLWSLLPFLSPSPSTSRSIQVIATAVRTILKLRLDAGSISFQSAKSVLTASFLVVSG